MRPEHEVDVVEVEDEGRVRYEVRVCGYVEDDFPERDEAEGVARGIIDGTLDPVIRTAITGVPRAGKTTLARKFVPDFRSTDDVIDMGWSEASAEVATWFNSNVLVIEGMAVPRALRKWLATHPLGRPVDRVIWLGRPYEKQLPGQAAMGVGAATVMREILPELRARGVRVVGFP